MADAKHTPGPWVARGSHLCADFGIVIDDKFVIAEVFADIRQKAKTDVEEARANARLIAAAPELLEALRETWRVIEQAGLLNLARGVQLGNTVWFVKASDAQQLSDRAIVKAVGVGS